MRVIDRAQTVTCEGKIPVIRAQKKAQNIYTQRNFITATRYFLIYLNIYDTYMAIIYTQYGKVNYTEPVKISFSLIEINMLN